MRKIFILISFLLICFTPFIVKAWTTLGVGQTVDEGGGDTYVFLYNADHVSGDDYAYTSSGTGSLQATTSTGTPSTTEYNSSPKSFFWDGANDTERWTTGISSLITTTITGEFSIEVWVYIDAESITATTGLFELYPSASAGQNMMRAQVESGGVVYFRHEGGDAVVSMTSTETVSARTWTRIRLRGSVTSNIIGIQIDSNSWEDDNDATVMAELTSAPDTLNIGKITYNSGDTRPAYIDDLSIISGYNTWND